MIARLLYIYSEYSAHILHLLCWGSKGSRAEYVECPYTYNKQPMNPIVHTFYPPNKAPNVGLMLP